MGKDEEVPRPVVIGVLAVPGLAQDLGRSLEERLPDALRERHAEADWKVQVDDEALSEDLTSVRELKKYARERMRAQGWDMAVVLTDIPLRSGRRPVTAHASAHQRVGLVSVPALGAVRLEERVEDAVLNLVDGMLGEQVGRLGLRRGRKRRMAGRLQELSSPIGAPRAHEEGTIRFSTAVLAGNLRLLAGMVRANNPSLVVVRLSRVLAAAGGTAAYALSSVGIWTIADGASPLRLVLISLGTITATIVTLIVSHDLWERVRGPAEREQIVLFNLATLLTVLIGVATLYLALVLIALGCSYALIAPGVFAQQLGHTVGFGDHLQLAFLTSAVATLAGALGSLTESEFAVREAMYRYRPDRRTDKLPSTDGTSSEDEESAHQDPQTPDGRAVLR
jgi:hypothetical protein